MIHGDVPASAGDQSSAPGGEPLEKRLEKRQQELCRKSAFFLALRCDDELGSYC
jgi:hypothetical protein